MTASWSPVPRPLIGSAEPAMVSVVIPCFNYARYLRGAISSALTQAGVDVQVIVVDDASTDESLAVARSAAAEDGRVSVLAHRVNRGPVATFNDGLELAGGEFLVRLDADDLLTPGSLQRAVAVCRSHPDVGLVYGRALHFSSAPPRARERATHWRVWNGSEWLADRCADAFNVITSPEAFMRMSVVRHVGGQRPLAHTHDMEMWLRLAAFSDVAYIRGADQAWHREHSDSLSARQVDSVRDLQERIAAFRELADGVASAQPGVAENCALALEVIARQATRLATNTVERGNFDEALVATYMEVAQDAHPGITREREWARLTRSIEGGPPPWLTAASRAVLRRIEWRRRRRHWERTGVWT